MLVKLSNHDVNIIGDALIAGVEAGVIDIQHKEHIESLIRDADRFKRVEDQLKVVNPNTSKAYTSIDKLYWVLTALGIKQESTMFIKFHNNKVWFISRHLK